MNVQSSIDCRCKLAVLCISLGVVDTALNGHVTKAAFYSAIVAFGLLAKGYREIRQLDQNPRTFRVVLGPDQSNLFDRISIA